MTLSTILIVAAQLWARHERSLPYAGPITPLDTRYSAQAIAARVLERLAAAPEGQRHYTLRRSAFTIGGLLDQLPFGEAEAARRLVRAVEIAGAEDLTDAERTARWGIERGKAAPLRLEAPNAG